MKTKNKKIFLILILITTVIFTFLSSKYPVFSFAQVNLNKDVSFSEKTALHFLLDKMQTQDGLMYSWVEHNENSPVILLETMGQALEYFALLEDRLVFEHYIKITNRYFLSYKGYYYWQISDGFFQDAPFVTAFVDDLRLAKAYFIARENSDKYQSELKILSDRIYKFNVDKNKFPVDFYDSKSRKKASELSLFYIDVHTLVNLAQFDKKWRIPYENAKNILLNMPENKFGFYPQKYKLETKTYHWQIPVNMVENLYTAINAKNLGKSTTKFVNFLQLQIIDKGKIYNYYDLEGNNNTTDESVAVYALAARLFLLEGNFEKAKWCYDKVQLYQIKEGDLKGGFGDLAKTKVYAFNQLEALLMYRYFSLIPKQ